MYFKDGVRRRQVDVGEERMHCGSPQHRHVGKNIVNKKTWISCKYPIFEFAHILLEWHVEPSNRNPSNSLRGWARFVFIRKA